jgi:hypothetical protein
MSLLAEGTWPCTVLSASFGEDEKGSPQAQINVRIEDGPSAGRPCTYEDQVNAKSALYIGRSLKAVGWKGRDLKTVKADVAEWIARTGGKSTVEIKHIELKKGKKYDRWVEGGCQGDPPVWDKANSVGRGPRVLNDASTERVNDANEAMMRALAADGGSTPDEPAAPIANEDIPFVTCSMRDDSAIARVLR